MSIQTRTLILPKSRRPLTYELERKVGVLEEKASAANRRLTDIERSEKHE